MSQGHRPLSVLAACCAVSTVLGSVHAFSVFVPEWEQLLGADRAGVSLVYSIALIALTCAVLLGYRVYRQLPPAALFAGVGIAAAAGLVLSAQAVTLGTLYLTYGLVFGGANGVGYGYALQLSGQALPKHRGAAMSIVTACYAVGATLAPVLFVRLIANGGNALALGAAAVTVGVVCCLAAMVAWHAGARFESESASAVRALPKPLARARSVLWLAYGSAVLSGLMVIGHAFSLAAWRGLDTHSAAWATTVVAFGNMLGGFSAGLLADRLSSRVLLIMLPLFSMLGLALLALPLNLVTWLLRYT
ncbi:MAG: MFS transporter [Pseudomonadota bacterium]